MLILDLTRLSVECMSIIIRSEINFELSLPKTSKLKEIRQKYRVVFASIIIGIITLMSGIYLGFQLERAEIRHKVRNNIKSTVKKSDLELITIHKDDIRKELQWKHAEEFEWNGEMYDIIYEDEKDDSLLYWCWADKEESALNRQMESWISHLLFNTPNSKEKHKTIQVNYNHLFISYANGRGNNLVLFKQHSPSYKVSHWLMHSQGPPSPPPKSIC